MQARSAGGLSTTRIAAGLAGVIAIGCAVVPGFALARTTERTFGNQQAPTDKRLEKQLVVAERAVAKAPHSMAGRARLAQTYLAAGRFASASTSFEDAVSLGDQTPATALGMALAYIGSGRNTEATALLGQWRESIPASDYALALALAGHPGEAVQILTETIRQGENTPNLRQNLAYAYALGGRLHEARVIASRDVPVDQLEARISDWALQASVGSQQSRVAALLGAPVRYDPGQPAQLALMAAPETAKSAVAVVEAPRPEPGVELPALGGDAPAMAFVQAEPVAYVAPQPDAPVAATVATLQFVSNPVVQDISNYTPHAELATAAPRRQPKAAQHGVAATSVAGSHVVQLGSFTTEAGARRAWAILVGRDRSLQGRALRITEATVHGRRYFRVAAVGYAATAAHAQCSTMRGRGGDCLVLADRRSSPGAMPMGAMAAHLARR